jgi:hypothetical protein
MGTYLLAEAPLLLKNAVFQNPQILPERFYGSFDKPP